MNAAAQEKPRPSLAARFGPLAVAIVISVVAFCELARGTFWLPGLLGTLTILAGLVCAWGRKGRVLAVNMIAIFGLLVAAEAYLLWARVPVEPRLSPPLSHWKRMHESASSDVYFYPQAPWASDDALGSIHLPNSKTTERRYFAGHLIASATYTTVAHGFRVVKPANRDADAVLLFGCSMTWGSNIEDRESYPWQLGELLGPTTQVKNFGIAGSGPNTMLGIIEAGYERESLPSGNVRGAYYVAWLQRPIGHLARVLGRVPWAASALRYRLNGEGRPPYVLPDGRFPLSFDQWLGRQSLLTAQLGRALGARKLSSRYRPEDLALLAGVVREADRLLQLRDRTPLTVLILTDYSARDLELQLADLLSAAKLRVLLLSLPPEAHVRGDVHPNALGARMLARAVANDLARPQPGAPSGAPVWLNTSDL